MTKYRYDHGFTAADLAKQGRVPKDFWLNSMGEYGHHWDSPDENECFETIGGSINMQQAVEEAGLVWEAPYKYPEHIRKRAFSQALHRELVHPIEFVLHRAHEHLSVAGSDLWRFYGGIDYDVTTGEPRKYDLTMSIEYILPTDRRQRLEQAVKSFAGRVEALHEDFENPNNTQFSVDFDVQGMGLGQVYGLQSRWLLIASSLTNELVSVL